MKPILIEDLVAVATYGKMVLYVRDEDKERPDALGMFVFCDGSWTCFFGLVQKILKFWAVDILEHYDDPSVKEYYQDRIGKTFYGDAVYEMETEFRNQLEKWESLDNRWMFETTEYFNYREILKERRLFLAVELPEQFKASLLEAQDELRRRGVQGNYTTRDNLHLTLLFIGETDRLAQIKRVVSEIEFDPFTIKTGHVGCFKRGNGHIWMGLEESNPLHALANEIRLRLKREGIAYKQTSPFCPHITLVSNPSEFVTDIDTQESRMTVEKISVMETETFTRIRSL